MLSEKPEKVQKGGREGEKEGMREHSQYNFIYIKYKYMIYVKFWEMHTNL